MAESKLHMPSELMHFVGMPAIVASRAIRELMDSVERVAKTNTSVLIRGESGTGKEFVARALHHYSLRCDKPWVDVSCAALPEHLVESELFGYEKGAFSGASFSKPGLFELANAGTLFLDEVGELEVRMQVKLLRALDGVPYYRLGGVRKIAVDVRIIAATNQNLEEMVDCGRFRSDLYYRLSQISLTVPPLRERRDDIVAFAVHFLKELRPAACFSGEALGLLSLYEWPGNVRELRNVVIRCSVSTMGNEIRGSDLAPEIAAREAARSVIPIEERPNLDAVERNMIMKVLAHTNGRQLRAAELLGISRRTLMRKLKTYDLERPS